MVTLRLEVVTLGLEVVTLRLEVVTLRLEVVTLGLLCSGPAGGSVLAGAGGSGGSRDHRVQPHRTGVRLHGLQEGNAPHRHDDGD